jgi:mono/diheme cytochrome c family protein/plastocyanin
MSDEPTGRELAPREPGGEVTPREAEPLGVERFDAGEQAHRVELTEERAAQIVRQSGNARSVAFLALLFVILFIPIYWFYDLGVPAVGLTGDLANKGQEQYVTDVSRGYALFLANCARCHGQNGEGGIGAPLNNQDALYNALTKTGQPGTGHLNPNYITAVLNNGGRLVCGDANSLMPIWAQPVGPLNYRQIQELVAFITASKDIVWNYVPDTAEGASGPKPTPVQVHGWRDPNYKPAAGATPYPACWRDPDGPLIGGPNSGPVGSGGPIESPGTPANPRIIKIQETGALQITDASGAKLSSIAIKAGETVKFEVTNVAGFAHDFFIGTPDQLAAGDKTNTKGINDFPSGTQELTYTFSSAGPLQFACIIPGHYGPMHGDFAIAP